MIGPLTASGDKAATLGRESTFRALRHTYASLCVAAGIPPLHISRFMGHAKVTTTLAIYTHLFDDDHAETMAALEAMGQPTGCAECGADPAARLGGRFQLGLDLDQDADAGVGSGRRTYSDVLRHAMRMS